jgi:hypothetical protein
LILFAKSGQVRFGKHGPTEIYFLVETLMCISSFRKLDNQTLRHIVRYSQGRVTEVQEKWRQCEEEAVASVDGAEATQEEEADSEVE